MKKGREERRKERDMSREEEREREERIRREEGGKWKESKAEGG